MNESQANDLNKVPGVSEMASNLGLQDPEALPEDTIADAVQSDSVLVDDAAPGEGLQALRQTLSSLDVDKMNESDVDTWLQQLIDLMKPGLIIDGQHRVRGTHKNNIVFNISALPEADWPELAFQFIILNMAAKKVQDSLLINIVGNSLTPDELGKIDKRLNDSGVPVPLYQGVMRIHEDPDSPFYKKLRFGINGDAGIIDAAAAKSKIVNFWFSCKFLYPLVAHLLPGKTRAEKIANWQTSEIWYEFFKSFWGPAKDFYVRNSNLWSNDLQADGKTPVSRLMHATIINLTQISVINYLVESLKTEIANDIDSTKSMETLLPNVATFNKRATIFFERLTPDFFLEWGPHAKGFDGSVALKNAYVDAVRSVISKKMTVIQLKRGNENLLFKDFEK